MGEEEKRRESAEDNFDGIVAPLTVAVLMGD